MRTYMYTHILTHTNTSRKTVLQWFSRYCWCHWYMVTTSFLTQVRNLAGKSIVGIISQKYSDSVNNKALFSWNWAYLSPKQRRSQKAGVSNHLIRKFVNSHIGPVWNLFAFLTSHPENAGFTVHLIIFVQRIGEKEWTFIREQKHLNAQN